MNESLFVPCHVNAKTISAISHNDIENDCENNISISSKIDSTILEKSCLSPCKNVIVNNSHTDKSIDLKIMVWNINGLGDKLCDKEFVDYINSLDLVIFLETMKLDTYVPLLSNFEYCHFQRKFQHARARKPSGGIGILIRTELLQNKSITIIKNSDFVVWVKIKQTVGGDIYLGAIYIPPLDSTSTITSFQDNNAYHLIQDDITHFSTLGHVTLCGDFNARIGTLQDFIVMPGSDKDNVVDCIPSKFNSHLEFLNYPRYSEDSKVNRYGKDLIELCKSSDLRIMNGYFNSDNTTGTFTCYTANGKSLIDYLICDVYCYHKLSKFEIDPLTSDSDHRPLIFSFKIDLNKSSNTIIPRRDSSKQKDKFYKYVFRAESIPGVIDTLNSDLGLSLYDNFIDNVVSGKSVDNVTDSIYVFLNTAISQNFEKKCQKSIGNKFPKNEWFDLECKMLKRKVNDYPKQHDLNMEDKLNEYSKLKKNYRATIQRKKRDFQNNIRDHLSNMNSNNPQEYWKYWDKIKKDCSVSIAGTVSLDSFDQYFSAIQAPPQESMLRFDMKFLNEIELFMKSYDEKIISHSFMTDAPITSHEVLQELKCLKLGKAPGIDGISNEFYKYLSDNMVQPLTILFNYVWENGEYPDKWSEGIIQPLHKKGSLSEPDNYRKLTLMACMGKLFESILNKRLVFQNEATNSIDHNQFGFCKGCRASDNVFIIDTLISYQKSRKKPLFITYVDFSKAFDFVNRTFLYYKLIQKGYGGRLLKIIQSLFAKSSARIRWEGQLGTRIDSTYGVLQGGIISPKLFNLYLADVGDYLNQTHGIAIDDVTFTHLLYADDLVLLSESASGMQELINDLAAYCRKWHLIVNSKKTKVMVIQPNRKQKTLVEHNFMLDEVKLEIVNSYKYLGHVICNSAKTHSLMLDHLTTQAQRAMHALKEKVKSTVGYLPPRLSLKMFDTHILPILEYNAEIWFSPKEIDSLEKIQLKYLKNMLCVRNQTSTIGILADTGRFPLLYRQQVSALKYWNRLNSDNCPFLLKVCHGIQKKMFQNNVKCWLSKLYNILGDLDVEPDTNIKHTIASLYTKAQEKLMLAINDSDLNPKLRTFKLFKTDLRLEPYLNHNLPKYVYSSIARFRLSSHNLHIELGRHKRPKVPADQRNCNRCNSNCIEDEFHCLMICSKWNLNRINLFIKACEMIDNFPVYSKETQFIKLLSDKNVEIVFELGKFFNTVLQVDNNV